MTPKELMRLALEADPFGDAGRLYDMAQLTPDTLKRFAALVAATERELIAAWVEDMCAGLDAKTIANGIRNGGNDDMRAFEVRK